jgi:ribosomal protein S18 acetylase RimI-like enzyme
VAGADGTITVRRAQGEDASRLSSIAQAAKAHWGYPARWLEIWREQLTIAAQYVHTVPVCVAEIDGQVAGFYAVEALGDGFYTLAHLWVDPGAMKQGVGKTLFRHLVAELERKDARSMRIESDPHAVGFYRRMGAVPRGTVTYELEGKRRELPVLILEFPIS